MSTAHGLSICLQCWKPVILVSVCKFLSQIFLISNVYSSKAFPCPTRQLKSNKLCRLHLSHWSPRYWRSLWQASAQTPGIVSPWSTCNDDFLYLLSPSTQCKLWLVGGLQKTTTGGQDNMTYTWLCCCIKTFIVLMMPLTPRNKHSFRISRCIVLCEPHDPACPKPDF